MRKRTEATQKKLDAMVSYIKENGPQKQRVLSEKFGCAKKLAAEAMTLCGYDKLEMRDWLKKSKIGSDQAYIEKLNRIASKMRTNPGLMMLPKRKLVDMFSTGYESIERVNLMLSEGITAEEATLRLRDQANKLKSLYRSRSHDILDAPMYRPEGLNPLCVAWR